MKDSYKYLWRLSSATHASHRRNENKVFGKEITSTNTLFQISLECYYKSELLTIGIGLTVLLHIGHTPIQEECRIKLTVI